MIPDIDRVVQNYQVLCMPTDFPNFFFQNGIFSNSVTEMLLLNELQNLVSASATSDRGGTSHHLRILREGNNFSLRYLTCSYLFRVHCFKMLKTDSWSWCMELLFCTSGCFIYLWTVVHTSWGKNLKNYKFQTFWGLSKDCFLYKTPQSI